MNSTKPMIVTPGEPGGIGLETALQAWTELHGEPALMFCLLADLAHLETLKRRGSDALPMQSVGSIAEARKIFAMALPVLHRPLPQPAVPGTADKKLAPWVIACIEEAAAACMAGHASALVTCPIQKETLYASGFAHEGHTDFLAHLARQRGYQVEEVMMLVGGGVKAVPVTVHIPLKDVPIRLTQQAIVGQARTVFTALKSNFAIPQPRLAITGLNPHAGENGAMGREEIDTIMPAINVLRAEGITIHGPLSADTAFTSDNRQNYDAILCMYHDQALIPVKALDFHGGVNVTLGLPFIRTSPDHGTALGLAGTGKARPDSLIAAIRLAAQMTRAAA